MELNKKNKSELENNDRKNVESTRGYFYITPDCDIYETDEGYKIIFEIPGIEKNDINLKVEKDVLALTAECSKQPVEGHNCLREEMLFSGYQRSFNLNNVVDTGQIQADYKGGVLTLTLPKKEEKKTKEIKVNIA